jgi:carbonic anhydrase
MKYQKTLFILLLTSISTVYGQVKISPNEALLRLKEGNQRFINGKSTKPRQDFNRIKEVATAQYPFATIVGCSDSRVPNEIIFDQGLGDLFIVRTAGQVSTYASWGSIEFAEEVLGTKLIVVLGHTQLKGLEPVLAKRVQEGSIKIIGALYDLNSGKIEFFE